MSQACVATPRSCSFEAMEMEIHEARFHAVENNWKSVTWLVMILFIDLLRKTRASSISAKLLSKSFWHFVTGSLNENIDTILCVHCISWPTGYNFSFIKIPQTNRRAINRILTCTIADNQIKVMLPCQCKDLHLSIGASLRPKFKDAHGINQSWRLSSRKVYITLVKRCKRMLLGFFFNPNMMFS